MRKYAWKASLFAAGLVGFFALPALAQDDGNGNGNGDENGEMESTYESTEMTTMSSDERYISSPVNIDDATPQPKGTMDFRLRWTYETASHGVNRYERRNTWWGGSRRVKRGERGGDDDTGLGLKWVWGPCENAEISLDLPINLGDGGKNGDELDGNADLTFGMLYRFWEEQDMLPAFAMSSYLRIPTGDRSSGVDAEFRGILTKTLVGDLRGHANAFLITANGNNDPDERHFQWGFVFGADMPLTSAKDLWLIVDYMHRNSEHYGAANMNILEAGVEWEFAQGQSFHFSTQVGLDDNRDTPNWGAKISYTHEF